MFYLFDLPYQILSFKRRVLCSPPTPHSFIESRFEVSGTDLTPCWDRKKTTVVAWGDAAWWLHGPFFVVFWFHCLVDFLAGRLELRRKVTSWKRWKVWQRYDSCMTWYVQVWLKTIGAQPTRFHALISACRLWLFSFAHLQPESKTDLIFIVNLLTISRNKHNTVWSNWWLSNWLFSYLYSLYK